MSIPVETSNELSQPHLTILEIKQGLCLRYLTGDVSVAPRREALLEFIKHPISGRISVMNLELTRDDVRRLLHMLADYVADNAEMEHGE